MHGNDIDRRNPRPILESFRRGAYASDPSHFAGIAKLPCELRRGQEYAGTGNTGAIGLAR